VSVPACRASAPAHIVASDFCGPLIASLDVAFPRRASWNGQKEFGIDEIAAAVGIDDIAAAVQSMRAERKVLRIFSS
jgi:hypothetical protein